MDISGFRSWAHQDSVKMSAISDQDGDQLVPILHSAITACNAFERGCGEAILARATGSIEVVKNFGIYDLFSHRKRIIHLLSTYFRVF